MATLARPHQRHENSSHLCSSLGDDTERELSSTVPSPFPLQELRRLQPQARSSSQLERRDQFLHESANIDAGSDLQQISASREAGDASHSPVEGEVSSSVENEETKRTVVVNDPVGLGFWPLLTYYVATLLTGH